jgi:hypothetical protein
MGKLEAKIRSETESLGGLNAKLDAASDKLAQLGKGGGKGSLSDQFDAMKKQEKVVDSLKAKLADKGDGIKALEGVKPSLDVAQRSAESAGHKFKEMMDAMEGANGVTGKLTAALKTLGPQGAAVAAVLTVVIGVVTALGVAFVDLFTSMVRISQEKDALSNTFEALSSGTESGRELVDALSDVAAQLPQSEGKILAWGKSLMSAGIEGEGLAVSVKAAASAAAIMGDEGATALISMEKQLSAGGAAADSLIKIVQQGGKKAAVQLANMGLRADDLAKSLGVTPEKMKTMKITAEQLSAALEEALINKGAKSLVTMGLTWDSIKGKLSDGVEDLFEDMGTAVAPFMATVKDLFSEFSAGSTTMSGVKSILTSVFTEVFSIAASAVNLLHKGFLYLEIGALKAGIALAPIGRMLKQLASNQLFIDGLTMALKGLGVIAIVVVAVMALMGGTVVALVAGFGVIAGLAATAFGAIVGSVMWLLGAILSVGGSIKSAIKSWFANPGEAASQLIAGLVNGITGGVGAVVGAIKSLGSAAASAFTGFFKIHSPSRLMFEYGMQLPAGVAGGVEAGTDDVTEAVGGMSKAGAGAAAPMAGAGAGRGGNTNNVVMNFYGVGEDVVTKVRTALLEVLEQSAGEAPMVVT